MRLGPCSAGCSLASRAGGLQCCTVPRGRRFVGGRQGQDLNTLSCVPTCCAGRSVPALELAACEPTPTGPHASLFQDPHNPELRAHVLRGDIGPEAFVQMTATDLASKASQLAAQSRRLARLATCGVETAGQAAVDIHAKSAPVLMSMRHWCVGVKALLVLGCVC